MSSILLRDIPDKLHDEFKSACATRRKSMKEQLQHLMLMFIYDVKREEDRKQNEMDEKTELP